MKCPRCGEIILDYVEIVKRKQAISEEFLKLNLKISEDYEKFMQLAKELRELR